jgi:hypothetical protein
VAHKGDSRKCSYGTADSNGSYSVTSPGPCSTATPPTGYENDPKHDIGFSAQQNRNMGHVALGIGAAGVLAGTIWWLWTRGEDRLDWSLEHADNAKSGFSANFGVGYVSGRF